MERDEQIGRLTSFISGAASGTAPGAARGAGRIAVISGPVASGKTALLHRALETAADTGPQVLTAVPSPAEQAIAFGVVEQLLCDAPAVDGLPPLRPPVAPTGPDAPQDVPLDVLEEFQARLTTVRSRGQVLIAVDDVQYADPQSLQCLAHALRAPSPGAPISLMVTHDPYAGGPAPRVLSRLLHQWHGVHLRLVPLSVDGVARLLAARETGLDATTTGTVPTAPTAGQRTLRRPARRTARQTAALADTLHAATGGNPLLVLGLMEDRLGRPAGEDPYRVPAPDTGDGHDEADPPAADGAFGPRPPMDLAELGDPAADPLLYPDGTAAPAPVVAGQPDEHFLRNALICVHRTGPDGLRVAQGIALLGSAGSMALLARLVEVEERTAARVVSALDHAGVLAGTRFRHGGVRAAVVESLADDEVTRLRLRAARLLYADGASPMAVAAQLLAHEMPAPEEEWAPRVLREAARTALSAQNVALAVRCLRLAEGCCADEAERMQLRAALAKYIWRVEPSAWAQQLRSLLGAVRDGLLPPADTLRLVRDLLWNGWTDDASAALCQVLAEMPDEPDEPLAAELRTLWLLLAGTYPTVLEQLDGAPVAAADAALAGHRAPTPSHPRLEAARVLHEVLGAAGAGEAADEELADTAERLLAATRLTEETHLGMRGCLLALLYADRLGTATVWTDRLLAEAADRRAPGWTAVLRGMRAHMSLRRGCLAEARHMAEQALEQLPPHSWGVGVGMPLAALIEARTAMGDHEAAGELVRRPVPEAMLRTRYGLHYLYARGRHRLATGRHHAALNDFAACGGLMRRWDMDRSALVPWRVGVAEASLALGSRDDAERFAREQLAGDAGPRVRGLALRVLATARPAAERPALLGEAVSLLQDNGDWYELARALSDLGSAYKQLGDAAQFKLHTRRARRIAKGCAAQELYRALQPYQDRTDGAQRQTAPAQAAGDAPTRLADRTVLPRPDRAAGAGRQGSEASASLTDAERRVAALAAHGYTNREISAKLFITVSTVEQHLTRVYRKINITHRQDLPVSLDIDVAHTA
ncbi:AAA family ATPase [Streptomyces sp. NPDC005784]|uniref:helix-turn-helix transcriptional regulator n=1 Tax=Streptomyces sp. NPDC005784 TaxID=3364731 RepID=UPI0036B56A10